MKSQAKNYKYIGIYVQKICKLKTALFTLKIAYTLCENFYFLNQVCSQKCKNSAFIAILPQGRVQVGGRKSFIILQKYLALVKAFKSFDWCNFHCMIYHFLNGSREIFSRNSLLLWQLTLNPITQSNRSVKLKRVRTKMIQYSLI